MSLSDISLHAPPPDALAQACHPTRQDLSLHAPPPDGLSQACHQTRPDEQTQPTNLGSQHNGAAMDQRPPVVASSIFDGGSLEENVDQIASAVLGQRLSQQAANEVFERSVAEAHVPKEALTEAGEKLQQICDQFRAKCSKKAKVTGKLRKNVKAALDKLQTSVEKLAEAERPTNEALAYYEILEQLTESFFVGLQNKSRADTAALQHEVEKARQFAQNLVMPSHLQRKRQRVARLSLDCEGADGEDVDSE